MNNTNAILWRFVHAYDPTQTQLPPALSFGDSPAMANELAELVLTGRKTATTSWPCDPSVQVGTLSIVLDGAGTPVAIIKTISVEQVAFLNVTPQFAAAEGEGDGTLRYWRDSHREFFTRVSRGARESFSDAEIVQCETFELVWPRPAGTQS